MFSGVWLIVAVLMAILLTWWVTFTVTRIGRLYARIDAAESAMDAQFVRRAAALLVIAETQSAHLGHALSGELMGVGMRALGASGSEREAAENDVGRAIAQLVELPSCSSPLHGAAGAELAEASARTAIARRFYNDAARDTRSLISGRMPRYLRLARGRELPPFFDIEDSPRWLPPSPDARAPEQDRMPEDPTLMEATDRG